MLAAILMAVIIASSVVIRRDRRPAHCTRSAAKNCTGTPADFVANRCASGTTQPAADCGV